MQVRITIRGRQYTVSGGDSSEDIQAVAQDLDVRLEEVAARTRAFDEYTIALLTALNLASEIRRLRQEVVEKLAEFDREAASVAAIFFHRKFDGSKPAASEEPSVVAQRAIAAGDACCCPGTPTVST